MKTILVVDDNPDVITSLKIGLEDSSLYRIFGAQNGKKCLELLEENITPDIIILDIMMPDISGLEVLRYLRREPDLLSIPVIVVSAKGMPGDIKTGIEAGASMYLTKPVGFLDLKQAVEQVLNKA